MKDKKFKKFKKSKKTKKNIDKKERYFNKHKKEFDDNTVTETNIYKYPSEKVYEYLKRNLSKKFKTDVNFECTICACSLLYRNRAVSDENLLKLPGVKPL